MGVRPFGLFRALDRSVFQGVEQKNETQASWVLCLEKGTGTRYAKVLLLSLPLI